MKKFLNWWYAVSLPMRPPSTTPAEKEVDRYARLTAGLLCAYIITFLPLGPIMLFFSPTSPSARPSAIITICLIVVAWLSGRTGHQRISASSIIACTFVGVTGPVLTNQFSASIVPIFGVFTVSIILAGALMPPIAALITGLFSCLYIVLVAFFALNTTTYNQGSTVHYQAVNTVAIAVLLPIIIQILVSIVVYVIMRNLLAAIRRAERAEEIIELQTAIAEHERGRQRDQKQLEYALEKIADAHARVANGDYHARVSLNEGDVLWSIAVPLNNLLNRLQSWKNDVEALSFTRQASAYIAEQIRANTQARQWRRLPLTKTTLDPVIVEVNKAIVSQPSHHSGTLP